jgi:hypothetical protein
MHTQLGPVALIPRLRYTSLITNGAVVRVFVAAGAQHVVSSAVGSSAVGSSAVGSSAQHVVTTVGVQTCRRHNLREGHVNLTNPFVLNTPAKKLDDNYSKPKQCLFY